MPAKSKAQQRFFGMLHSKPGMAKQKGIDMTQKQIGDFASTSQKNLPERVAPKKKPRRFRSMAQAGKAAMK